MASQPNQTKESSTAPPTIRRPYRGSCHCGEVQYIVYLTFPPILEVEPDRKSTIRIYKCNCTSCHKTGMFHVRVPDASNDFIVLSPPNPAKDLGDYQCFDKFIHWYFCQKCGVRCFIFNGPSEVAEVDLQDWGVKPKKGSEGKLTRVWRPEEEGYVEGKTGYLSINAITLEPGQEGFDLNEWTEKQWILYMDCKDEKDEDRFGKPHRGGTY